MFSISQREVTQTRERGVTLACFTEKGNLSSRSVTMVTYSMNLTWLRPGFSSTNLEFLSVSALFQPHMVFDFLIHSASRRVLA